VDVGASAFPGLQARPKMAKSVWLQARGYSAMVNSYYAEIYDDVHDFWVIVVPKAGGYFKTRQAALAAATRERKQAAFGHLYGEVRVKPSYLRMSN